MAPTFLAQLAAGCLLVVGISDLRNSGWKYLRLMALVSLGLAFLALLLIARDDPSALKVWRGLSGGNATASMFAVMALGAALMQTLIWLFVNAVQAESVQSMQRIWPIIAGVSCLCAAAVIAFQPDLSLPGARQTPLIGTEAIRAAVTTALGALLLGGVTAGMLLGHRYLTDTDMPIAPLRRLTHIYLVTLIARVIWVAALAWPIFSHTFRPSGGPLWFWIVLTIRGGVGLLGAAVFAWMIRDCVKSRATQSATAIFYLSMVFVYLGELAAQYLLRTEGLPI